MDSDDGDNYESLYEDGDASKHEKLVHKILSLNKTQSLKKPSRTEPTLQISEFNLVKSITGDKGSIRINELTEPLKKKKSRTKISDNIKSIQKRSHVLPKPLEKPQANRIRRAVAYEKTRLQLDRWEPTITANRVATNLSFPLDNDFKMEKKEAEKFPTMWRVKSKLEEALEQHEPKVEEFHINLEEEFPLTMKEMLERRKEAAKLRAYQGYKEAKARRQNKIKSKKYHRIQKRERIKQKLKEFEHLQKVNPEEALQKLEEIEKCRAEERFSLRHKSTGKWARNQQIRAKYDKESRQELAKQLSLSKELTQKLKSNESGSDEETEDAMVVPTIDKNNPWVNGIKPDKEVTDFITGYRKYWAEENKQEGTEAGIKKIEEHKNSTKEENRDIVENSVINPVGGKTTQKDKTARSNKIKKQNKKQTKKTENAIESKSTSDWEVSFLEDDSVLEDMFSTLENKHKKNMLRKVEKLKNELKPKRVAKKSLKDKKEEKKVDLTLPLPKLTPQVDEELIEKTSKENENGEHNQDLTALQNILSSQIENKEKQNQSDIDPNKYINVKPTTLSTAIPDILTLEENEDEEEQPTQRDIISEAFEDDDIIEEFNKEKSEETERNKPKDIDLSLPGWGSWGGTNIKPNKRKQRRFIIKAPAKIPRRDDNKGSLLINEKAQKAIKEHMVSEVPFPFKSVADFEASMRAPISNTFVPETAYKKLIQPSVTTKMGTIIEPMNKDILLNKNG